MTIKEYEAKLREIDPENVVFEGWKVVRLKRDTLLVMFNDFVEFVIYDLDLDCDARVEPSSNTTELFSNNSLDLTIKILQVTNEFIKNY